MTREEYAIAAQGARPITAKQLQTLIITARKAYDTQRDLGLADDFGDFDKWRKGQLYYLTENSDKTIASFRDITQRDYSRVLKHFSEHALMMGTAEKCKTTEQDEYSRAHHAFKKTIDEVAHAFDSAEGALLYAAAIYQDQYRCPLPKATAKQIWRIIFTLKNRAKKKTANA